MPCHGVLAVEINPVESRASAARQAQERLGKCQVKGASEAQIESAQAQVAAGEARVAHWQAVHDPYRGHLEAIALQVHPWRVEDSTPQSAQEVEAQLGAEVTALQALMEANGLPVKEKGLDKVRKQLADWPPVDCLARGRQMCQPDGFDAAVGALGGGVLVAADVLEAARIAHTRPPS